jgi:hypothetical protein
MGLLDKLGIPVYRKCPANKWHRVSAENPSCGHTGVVLDWTEEYQRWVANPHKTALAKDQYEQDSEFDVEREARLRLEEAVKNGDLKAVEDIRRTIMGK